MSDEQAAHKLGEVLREAREARGVDLARVERDTKIRVRYLAALESGEYRDLPGAVYTKGFLRNYAAYLGLDADYLIDLYRLETSTGATERVSVRPPPSPITPKRARAFVLTPGVIVAAILTALVVVFIVYFANEFITFARTPGLTISQPAGDLASYPNETLTIAGVTEPNAVVHVEGAVENPSVTADAEGRFELEVRLVPGSNVITLIAADPLTGRNSDPVSRMIVVTATSPSPTPGGGLAIDAPEEGATLTGPIEVTGTADPGSGVTVSAMLVAVAEPTFTIVNPLGQEVPLPEMPPEPPQPITVEAGGSGRFSVSLPLLPATWQIRVESTVAGAEAVTREVRVVADEGLRGTLRVEGGVSYLEVDEDGDPRKGISGRNAEPGTAVELTADERLRIRVGNAGAVTLEINGVDLGTMGGSGAVIEWRITRL